MCYYPGGHIAAGGPGLSYVANIATLWSHSVHFTNPVVSAAWCLLCLPLLPPASGQSCDHVTAISGFNNESESKGDRTSESRLTEQIRPVLW